jgi:acetyl-CoA synthetase
VDRSAIIRKTAFDLRVEPNLADYRSEYQGFSWNRARDALAGLPGGGLNIAFEAVDRHAAGPRAEHTAFRFVSQGAPPLELSYGELARLTDRFAQVLLGLGIV